MVWCAVLCGAWCGTSSNKMHVFFCVSMCVVFVSMCCGAVCVIVVCDVVFSVVCYMVW